MEHKSAVAWQSIFSSEKKLLVIRYGGTKSVQIQEEILVAYDTLLTVFSIIISLYYSWSYNTLGL